MSLKKVTEIAHSALGNKGIRMLMGDVGGTDIGISLSAAAAEGEAYHTGILCMPEEDLLYRSERMI